MKAFSKIILPLILLCNSVLLGDPHFYHGSSTDGIERLEPRRRYTPGEEFNSPASIYASDLPAFAAAHSFPWATEEGVDLYVDGSVVTIEIPRTLLDRLQQSTYIYTVDATEFSPVESESTGHTFRSTKSVDCLEKTSFKTVIEAIDHYGGRVVIKEQ